GARLTQLLVHGGTTAVIGVAADLDPELLPLAQNLAHHVEPRQRLGQQVGLAGLEVDVLEPDHAGIQQLGLLFHHLDRATVRIHAQPGGRVRALVQPVAHAVAVRVLGAALGVDGAALGRIGALVDAVVDAVAVGVAGAALGVDRRAPRRVGALVEAVIDAVAVGVAGAALGVDRRTLGRIR